VGKIWKAEEEAFKLLLQLDTIRGPHSTGVLSVSTNNKEDLTWLKSVGTPWELFELDDWQKLIGPRSHRVLLGHNRWATSGKVTNENAHPFEHGTFTGVHNGTLRAQHRLKDHKDHEVDSSNIYYNMAHEGVEDTLKKLEGPFALVWYDSAEGKLQMVRNSERPLWICKTTDGDTYFWASEPWMMRVALNKHGIKHGDPVELEPGKLVSFDVPFGFGKKGEFKPSIKDVEFYKYVAPPREDNDYYSQHHWAQRRSGGYGYHSGSAVNSSNTGGGRNNVVPFVKPGVGVDSLKLYLGKTVVFSVIGERTSNKQDYILAEVEDHLAPQVRVFTPPKKKLGKLLLGSEMLFRGKVKSCTAQEKFGNYLTLDHRTIIPVVQEEMVELLNTFEKTNEIHKQRVEDVPEEKFVSGFRGLMIPLDQWFKNTENGCSWCRDFAKVSEAEELMWLKSDEYLCPLCQVDDEVLSMINLPDR